MTITHWIDGSAFAGSSDRTGDVFDPATGELRTTVAFADPDDVDAAVAAARRAFETWGRATLTERMSVLFRFRELLNAHRDQPGRTHHPRARQVLADAVGRSRAVRRWSSSPAARRICSRAATRTACRPGWMSTPSASRWASWDHLAVQLPGDGADVVLPDRDCGGNTVVLKPSEKDPSAAMFLAQPGPRPGFPTASSTSSTATRWR